MKEKQIFKSYDEGNTIGNSAESSSRFHVLLKYRVYFSFILMEPIKFSRWKYLDTFHATAVVSEKILANKKLPPLTRYWAYFVLVPMLYQAFFAPSF